MTTKLVDIKLASVSSSKQLFPKIDTFPFDANEIVKCGICDIRKCSIAMAFKQTISQQNVFRNDGPRLKNYLTALLKHTLTPETHATATCRK